MQPAGDPGQQRARAEYRAFADACLRAQAAAIDAEERLPEGLVADLAARGYLGAVAPAEHGGAALDPVSLGFLHEEIGAVCSSTRTLLTVHAMVTHAVDKCGSAAQRGRFLPAWARGERIAAFGLTEPEVGSDARSVQTTAARDGDGWRLDGCKRWTSFGQIADDLLVLARDPDGRPIALIVDLACEGVKRVPIRGLLGTRGAMLAEIRFEACRVSDDRRVGAPGWGFNAMSEALDLGRYMVAWGCVGIAQACLTASARYSRSRQQGGKPIGDHQLVARMLADMMTDVRAARLLAMQAAVSRQACSPSMVADTLVAKYFASRAATRAASDAVQIHGANGVGAEYPVARYYRDAKIMEIIEGSNEIQQVLIARHAEVDAEA